MSERPCICTLTTPCSLRCACSLLPGAVGAAECMMCVDPRSQPARQRQRAVELRTAIVAGRKVLAERGKK